MAALLRGCGLPWRVRDKYNAVHDSSTPPPLSADNFITPEAFTSKACARRVCHLCANRLEYKLADGNWLSKQNSINLLHDFLSAPLSRQPLPGSVQFGGAPLNRRDAMGAEAGQAQSPEDVSLKGDEFERTVPCSLLHTAISRFAHRRRRFNAETRRVAGIRKELLFSALLPTATVEVDHRLR